MKHSSLSHLYTQALAQAEQYDGRETSYESLTDLLIKIEDALIRQIRGKVVQILGDTSIAIPESEELAWTEIHLPDELKQAYAHLDGISIGHILGFAGDQFAKRYIDVTEGTVDEALEASGIFQVHMDEVYLIPDESIRPQRSADGMGEWKEQEFINRIFPLITFLQQYGIYTDDLLLWRGMTLPSQMRRIPYILVEIPRLRKQILVCNLVGEATFVIRGVFSPEYFTRYTKEELQNKHPQEVIRIVHKTDEQWLSGIAQALFTEADGTTPTKSPMEKKMREKKKWTAEEMYKLKYEIRGSMTFEEWVELGSIEAREYRIAQHSIKSLYRVFLGQWETGAHLFISRLRLAEHIWPEYREKIFLLMTEKKQVLDQRKVDKEELISSIRSSRISLEAWISMDLKDAKRYRCQGLSMRSIFRVLYGYKGSSEHSYLSRLQMAQEIWPEQKVTIQPYIDSYDPEKLPNVIREQITFENWMNMTQSEALLYRCYNLSIYTLYNIFFEEYADAHLHGPRLRMAEKIWPEKKDEIQYQKYVERKEITKEELIDQIRNSEISYHAWIGMSQSVALNYRHGGLSLVSIHRILLNKINARGHLYLPRLYMAKVIWPEWQEDAQRRIDVTDPQKLSEIIRSNMTFERWCKMTEIDTLKYNIGAVGIYKMYTVLVGEKSPSSSMYLIRLKMAQVIWPEEKERVEHSLFEWKETIERKELTRGELVDLILESGMTYNQWIAMSHQESVAYLCNGLSMRKIYRILYGESHRLAPTTLGRLRMARVIWPEHGEEIGQMIKEKEEEE